MLDGQSQTQQPQTPRSQRQVFPQPAGHNLAQVNLACAVDALDQPAMAEFMAALNKVNGIAERSPGFVWRRDDPLADARSKDILADPRQTYILSVWETAEALEFFAWNTVHRRFMNSRHKWFVPPDRAFLAVWWMPAGTSPDFAEAMERLEYLGEHGPSERAFGWKSLVGTRVWQSEGAPPIPA